MRCVDILDAGGPGYTETCTAVLLLFGEEAPSWRLVPAAK